MKHKLSSKFECLSPHSNNYANLENRSTSLEFLKIKNKLKDRKLGEVYDLLW